MLYVFTEYYKDTSFLESIEKVKVVKTLNGSWPELDIKKNDKILYLARELFLIPPYPENMLCNIEGILTAKNKKECRLQLQNSGLSVPKTWFNIDEATIPFIARPGKHSFGGNFYIIRSLQKKKAFIAQKRINENWYYSEIIDVIREYRVMILNGEIFLVYNRQLFRGLERTLKKREQLRRTHSFQRHECSSELTKFQKDLCINALKYIHLYYGAVDLAIDREGNAYILEINTSPMLNSSFVQGYLGKAIEKLSMEVMKNDTENFKETKLF